MNNVQCANPRMVTLTDGGQIPFCGWKGERLRSWPASWRNGYGYRKTLTAKPCPRCGGRVELIPTRGAP